MLPVGYNVDRNSPRVLAIPGAWPTPMRRYRRERVYPGTPRQFPENQGMSFTDLRGQRFGYVTVVERALPVGASRSVLWTCFCDCGGHVQLNTRQLTGHDLPNCGCLRNIAGPPSPAPENARWIPLTKGMYTLVDAEDFERVSAYKWTAFPTKDYREYYASNLNLGRLHRWLMNASRGARVDHWNRNPLDNRKSNLRFCSSQQNAQNRKRRRDSTAPYKGIHWRSGFWDASIQHDGRTVQLGRFTNPEQAALAYDEAARRWFGEFACCSFPEAQRLNDLPGGAKTVRQIGTEEYDEEAQFAALVQSSENARLDYRRMEQIIYEMRARRGEVVRRPCK